MIHVNDITENQEKRITHFYKFYSEEQVNKFKDFFASKREEIKSSDFYCAYLSIIKNAALIIKSLGVDNPFQASVIFEYLLWNGYFSKNKKLVYSISNRSNNIGALGLDIMLGKSVCINNATMLSDILNEMNIRSYVVGCKVNNSEKNKLSYKPNIFRNIEDDKNSIFSSIFGKIIGNHAVTLFEWNNMYFLSDPTSLGFLNFNDFMRAKFIGAKLSIDIKPWLMLLLSYGEIQNEEFYEIFETSFKYSDSQMSLGFVEEFSEASLEICQQNKILLEDFYNENVESIDFIHRSLTKRC